MTDSPREGTGHEQPTELVDSNPNAGGPDRAAGDMGVSSERVGATGGGAEGTDGERETSEPDLRDAAGTEVGSDAEAEAGDQPNSEASPPKAGYPSADPRSKDAPYKHA